MFQFQDTSENILHGLVPRLPLTAFFPVVEKMWCFFHGCKTAARGGLGKMLGCVYVCKISLLKPSRQIKQ